VHRQSRDLKAPSTLGYRVTGTTLADCTRRHKDFNAQPRTLLGTRGSKLGTAAVMTGCLNSGDSGCLIGETQVTGVQLDCRVSDQAIANTTTRALPVL
jgi:hypothetical protein